MEPVDRSAMERIRVWRNQQIDVLRQSRLLDVQDQQRYYGTVVAPEFSKREPSQLLFTLGFSETRGGGGSLVGYGGLTHVNWEARRAELSYLPDPQRAEFPEAYRLDLLAFLKIVVNGIAFEDLGLHRVWHETFDLSSRIQHVRVIEEFGFQQEGIMRDHAIVRGVHVDCFVHGVLAR